MGLDPVEAAMPALKDVKVKLAMHMRLGGGGFVYAYENAELGIYKTKRREKHTAPVEVVYSAKALGDREFTDLAEFEAALVAEGVLNG